MKLDFEIDFFGLNEMKDAIIRDDFRRSMCMPGTHTDSVHEAIFSLALSSLAQYNTQHAVSLTVFLPYKFSLQLYHQTGLCESVHMHNPIGMIPNDIITSCDEK